MRPEKLSDPRRPRLRRNRITSADFWPFWAPGNRIDAKFGVPAEILGLERLTAKFACLQKPATSCWRHPGSRLIPFSFRHLSGRVNNLRETKQACENGFAIGYAQ
jgi:hypothetical protein